MPRSTGGNLKMDGGNLDMGGGALLTGSTGAAPTSGVTETLLQLGPQCAYKRFRKSLPLVTSGAVTTVGFTPNGTIISAGVRVDSPVTLPDSAAHHLQLGIAGTAAKYIDITTGAGLTLPKNSVGSYTQTSANMAQETQPLVLTITGGVSQTPTNGGSVTVEVVTLETDALPSV